MKNVDVIRAWKDSAYRSNLSQDQLAALPQNPAGALSDIEAEMISGGEAQWTSKTGRGGCDECEMK